MARRKPAPRVASPKSESSSTHGSVDASVTRYSLTDRPVSLSEEQDSPLLTSDHGHAPNDEMRGMPLSVTMRNATAEEYDREGHAYNEPQPPARSYQPYQPGQYLAPIVTGETLQLEDIAQGILEEQDPFNDPSTPIAQPAQLQFDVPLQDGPYQVLEHPPAPSSDYHSQQSSEYYSQRSSVNSYTPLTGAEPLLAGSDIDHFQHDAEAAYSSATAYTSPYRPPRSRSPTPAVDDEDYHIVGNESVHYTGGYDPEKEALQEQYAGYLMHEGYLASTHNIVFDPDPPTPTSQQASLPETLLDTQHFGPAPSGRVTRRHKTKKRVLLTNGNLVMNLHVPPRLALPRRGVPEMMQTRYTAVTCDPDDFEKSGFFLRQNESGRRTELLIIFTMYNVRPFFLLQGLE